MIHNLPLGIPLTLLFSALGVLISEITYHKEKHRFIRLIASLGILTALLQCVGHLQGFHPQSFIGDAITFDGMTFLFQFLILLGALGSVLILGLREAEQTAFLLFHTLFACIAVSATDLLVMLICAQFWFLGSIFLAKQRVKGSEGKVPQRSLWTTYLVSVLAVGFFGLGCAAVFSHYGTLNLFEIASMSEVKIGTQEAEIIVSLLSIPLLILFAVFPWVGWSLDLFDQCPPSTAVWISWGGQLISLAWISRLGPNFFTSILGEEKGRWLDALSILVGASLLLAALLSVFQNRIRSILGSAVFSQGALLLICPVFFDFRSLSQALYFLFVQLIAWIGIFLCLRALEERVGGDDIRLLEKVTPNLWLESFCFLFFLAFLVGLPPTAGFFSRFFLISTGLQKGVFGFTWIVVISAIIWVATFARIFQAIFGKGFFSRGGDAGQLEEPPTLRNRSVALLIVPIIFLTIFSQSLLRWIQDTLSQ